MSGKGRAVVVGSGPNGLSAAIVLAQAGMEVEVFEAEAQPGGGARTMELTVPGFHHDFGSAVHPLGVGSPFFRSLPLQQYGLEWIESPAALAHPLDDGSAVSMYRDLARTVAELGVDGRSWEGLVAPYVRQWADFSAEVLAPLFHLPKHPLLLARFGTRALLPATLVAKLSFKSSRTRAMFAGLAAHSMLSLTEPLTGAFGLLFGITIHAAGWPIPRGGAQAITRALTEYLASLGGRITHSTRIQHLRDLGRFDVAMLDVSPQGLLQIAGERFTRPYVKLLEDFRRGPGAFKVDYALSAPIPWRASECKQAITVHLGGTLEEIAESESISRHGGHAERPFVLLAQPTLYDSTRAPAGKHIAWAYCHVPTGSDGDMLPQLEAQIERFAPGFRDCVLAHRVSKPSDLEAMDANLVGGDIGGGVADWRQFALRPTWRQYATPDPGIYLCSSSTPPGAGVHGMCGYNAAMMALKRLR